MTCQSSVSSSLHLDVHWSFVLVPALQWFLGVQRDRRHFSDPLQPPLHINTSNYWWNMGSVSQGEDCPQETYVVQVRVSYAMASSLNLL